MRLQIVCTLRVDLFAAPLEKIENAGKGDEKLKVDGRRLIFLLAWGKYRLTPEACGPGLDNKRNPNS
jgi:hypothetical protein